MDFGQLCFEHKLHKVAAHKRGSTELELNIPTSGRKPRKKFLKKGYDVHPGMFEGYEEIALVSYGFPADY